MSQDCSNCPRCQNIPESLDTIFDSFKHQVDALNLPPSKAFFLNTQLCFQLEQLLTHPWFGKKRNYTHVYSDLTNIFYKLSVSCHVHVLLVLVFVL